MEKERYEKNQRWPQNWLQTVLTNDRKELQLRLPSCRSRWQVASMPAHPLQLEGYGDASSGRVGLLDLQCLVEILNRCIPPRHHLVEHDRGIDLR